MRKPRDPDYPSTRAQKQVEAKRNKIDKRTKAYRDRHKRVEKAVQTYQEAKAAPVITEVAGRAGVVLSILALVANFAPEVRKQIIAQAGTLA